MLTLLCVSCQSLCATKRNLMICLCCRLMCAGAGPQMACDVKKSQMFQRCN